MARNPLAQDPGRIERHAIAAGIPNLALRNSKRHKAGTPYCVTPTTGEAFRIAVSGRIKWALEELRTAGAEGCTPIDNPAPRRSAYTFSLRELGVDVETITEPHGGDYSGRHARYVLRPLVSLDWQRVAV